MKKLIFRNILIGILIGSSTLFAGVRFFESATADELIEPKKKIVKVLDKTDLEHNVSELVAYGEIEAIQDFDLAFQVNGKVKYVYLKPGAHVYPGQAIALIENDALAAQVSQAAAGFDAAYNSYLSTTAGVHDLQIESARSQVKIASLQLEQLEESMEELDDQDLDTEQIELQIEMQEEVVDQMYYSLEVLRDGPKDTDLSAQWAMVEQARAGLEGAVAAYDEIILRAPSSGELVTLNLTPGEQVNPGQAIGRVINRDNIEVVTYLSSKDIRKISGGNEAFVDNRYPGKVIGISSRTDEFNGKRKVRIEMPFLGQLTVGDTVRVEIDENLSNELLLVPLPAIQLDDEDSYVFVYDDGIAKALNVRSWDVRGNFIEVSGLGDVKILEFISGIKEGDLLELSK